MKSKVAFALSWLILPVVIAGEQELHISLRAEPKTFDPLMTADDASDTIRYLTGGVLVRVNRLTQELQPEVAISWKVLPGGRSIRFQLRDGLRFSDGSLFSAHDVAWTFRSLMEPELKSPIAESFRSGDGNVAAVTHGNNEVTITFRRRSPVWYVCSTRSRSCRVLRQRKKRLRSGRFTSLNISQDNSFCSGGIRITGRRIRMATGCRI